MLLLLGFWNRKIGSSALALQPQPLLSLSLPLSLSSSKGWIKHHSFFKRDIIDYLPHGSVFLCFFSQMILGERRVVTLWSKQVLNEIKGQIMNDSLFVFYFYFYDFENDWFERKRSSVWIFSIWFLIFFKKIKLFF